MHHREDLLKFVLILKFNVILRKQAYVVRKIQFFFFLQNYDLNNKKSNNNSNVKLITWYIFNYNVIHILQKVRLNTESETSTVR